MHICSDGGDRRPIPPTASARVGIAERAAVVRRPRVAPTVLGALLALAVLVAAASCSAAPPSSAPVTTAANLGAGDSGGSTPGTAPGSAPRAAPGSTERSSSAPGSTSPMPIDDRVVDPIAWEPCDTPAYECGTLTVPVDYRELDGDTIDIAVIRRPATGRDAPIGSLIVNPGGPGASGIDFVKSGAPGRTLASDFDIVSWDPRGVGLSAPIVCNAGATAYRDLDWSPDDATEARELDDAARSIADDCDDKEGDMLAHVSTDDTARDLDRLRRAVGDEKLTYMGFSYGTYIGERYAELFPTNVRAMVLDGVVDPTADLDTLLLGQAEALEKQVNELFASCSTRRSCPMDDPAAAYDELAARVEERPMGTGAHQFGPTALAFAAVSASYGEESGDAFLAGLDDALRGDASTLQALTNSYFSSGSYSSYLAVLCTGTPHPMGSEEYTDLAERLAEASPRFGAAVANEVRPCGFWPAPAVESTDPVRAKGSPPILVVGNTGDVATPFEDAERVASDLDNGVLLTYRGSGHTSYGKSTCVDGLVNSYLVELVLPDTEKVCD